jgi:hypothetical protein
MRKKQFLLAVLFLSLSYAAYAQNFKGETQKLSILEPGHGLRAGEALEYSVEWLGIPVGKAILKVNGIAKINNHDCYQVTAQAIPNKFLKRFINLEYEVHTYIDTQYFYTRRFEKTRSLNNKTAFVAIDFDQEKNEATYKAGGSAKSIIISPVREQIKAKTQATNKIPKGAQDLLSAFYYLRLAKINENGDYSLNIYYDQRNWQVNFKVEKPFLKDIYKKGSFSIFKVSPDSGLNDFILGRRKFTVYFTADSRRIPLEFRFDTGVGLIRGIIRDIPQ